MAAALERTLLYDVLKWYRMSRREHDARLVEALKDMAAEERRSGGFWRLPLRDRARFCLAFSCYPLYRLADGSLQPYRRLRNGRQGETEGGCENG